MITKSIVKAVKKLDGVILREKENSMFAMCRGYYIEFIGGSVLTIRKTSKRKDFDPGSDYNPGGYIFLRRIKDLNYYLAN